MSICNPPQDFNSKGESARTTRFHFKTNQFFFDTRQHTCNLASLAISFVSEDTLETIKREQVEEKSVLKFSNKSPVRKSTTRFQCAQKYARRLICRKQYAFCNATSTPLRDFKGNDTKL